MCQVAQRVEYSQGTGIYIDMIPHQKDYFHMPQIKIKLGNVNLRYNYNESVIPSS